MSSGDLIPDNYDRSEPDSPEVQFALVIARMIDTIKDSPEDMRQAVYDLARYKLQEQFTYADAKDIKRTEQALETAIRGFEEFSKQEFDIAPTVSSSRLDKPNTDRSAPPKVVPPLGYASIENDARIEVTQVRSRSLPRLEVAQGPIADRSATSGTLWPILERTTAVVAIIFVAFIAFQQHERLVTFARVLMGLNGQSASQEGPSPAQVDRSPVPIELPPVKPTPLRPTNYGVYAIANDTLFELQLLPGRPPDIRVAVSAALKTPSRTHLPTGRPKFIIFRRDVASSIVDRAEVRIIAKIDREFRPDVIGKKPAEGNDTWVIRNISVSFRASPVDDNPEMYELHSEDSGLELTPGRYALILKNQAYDFSVEGEIVDPKQCIERIVASNGTFYSDCKKP